MSQFALEKLTERFREGVLSTHAQCGDETAVVNPSLIRAMHLFLRDSDELQFDMLTDLTAVDNLGQPTDKNPLPRFFVVYHLYSTKHRHRLRLKVGVEIETPVIESISDLYKNADWLEREVWDLYGIRFDGHPNLRRILLYEEFVGHPLRKDYPKSAVSRSHGDRKMRSPQRWLVVRAAAKCRDAPKETWSTKTNRRQR